MGDIFIAKLTQDHIAIDKMELGGSRRIHGIQKSGWGALYTPP
jgi:hypothetical protein